MKPAAAPFYVVSGTHGVGKTTVLQEARQLLDRQGMAIRQFHHITDIMPGKTATPQVQPRPAASQFGTARVPLWRCAIPGVLKQAVASYRDEMTYMRGIRRILSEAAIQGRIVLCDRYAYDRLVDLRLNNRPAIQRVAVRMVCLLLRKPTLTILLTDDPGAIRKRKQELSESEIAWYQDELERVCARMGIAVQKLPVAGRNAKAVAEELATIIVQTTGSPRVGNTA